MSYPKVFALLVLLSFTLAACSKHKDPTLQHREKDAALQTALDELKRLSSYTETGLSYAEYSERFLTAKGNIDVALQHTTDEAAKSRIKVVLAYYTIARDEWKIYTDHPSGDTWIVHQHEMRERSRPRKRQRQWRAH